MSKKEEPKNWVVALALFALIVLYSVGKTAYKEYLSREAKLTKVIQEAIAKQYTITAETPWMVTGLYIYSTEIIHNTDIKTYNCRFGLVKRVVNGEWDIVECEAPVLYNTKFKPYYNVIGMHEIDE